MKPIRATVIATGVSVRIIAFDSGMVVVAEADGTLTLYRLRELRVDPAELL